MVCRGIILVPRGSPQTRTTREQRVRPPVRCLRHHLQLPSTYCAFDSSNHIPDTDCLHFELTDLRTSNPPQIGYRLRPAGSLHRPSELLPERADSAAGRKKSQVRVTGLRIHHHREVSSPPPPLRSSLAFTHCRAVQLFACACSIAFALSKAVAHTKCPHSPGSPQRDAHTKERQTPLLSHSGRWKPPTFISIAFNLAALGPKTTEPRISSAKPSASTNSQRFSVNLRSL